jgi:hypothetical protein
VNRKQILHLSRLQAALQFAPQIQTLKHQAGQSNAALATGIAAQAAAADEADVRPGAPLERVGE